MHDKKNSPDISVLSYWKASSSNFLGGGGGRSDKTKINVLKENKWKKLRRGNPLHPLPVLVVERILLIGLEY